MGEPEERAESGGGDVKMSKSEGAVIEKKDGEVMNGGSGGEGAEQQRSEEGGGGQGAETERAADGEGAERQRSEASGAGQGADAECAADGEGAEPQRSEVSGGGQGADTERAADGEGFPEDVGHGKEPGKSDGVEEAKKDTAEKEPAEHAREGDSVPRNSTEPAVDATPIDDKARVEEAAPNLTETAAQPGQAELDAPSLPTTESQVDKPANAADEPRGSAPAPETDAKDSQAKDVEMQIDSNTDAKDSQAKDVEMQIDSNADAKDSQPEDVPMQADSNVVDGAIKDDRMQADAIAKDGESRDDRMQIDAKEPDQAGKVETEVQKSEPKQEPQSTPIPSEAASTGAPQLHDANRVVANQASSIQDPEAQRAAEEERQRLQKEKELEELRQREAEERERQKEEKLRLEKEKIERERIERELREKRRKENVDIIARKAVEVLEADAERRKRAAVTSGKGSKGTADSRPEFVTKAAAQKARRTRERNGVKVDLDVAESGRELLHREFLQFRKLLELERQLDMTIMRKNVELTESVRRNVSIQPRIFRLYVESRPVLAGHGAHWNLRVFGKLLPQERAQAGVEEAGWREKGFTELFRRASVQVRRATTPPAAMDWDNNGQNQNEDGFEIQNVGSVPFAASVSLAPSMMGEMYQIQEPLASILGLKCGTKQGILTAFWNYIKSNDLQYFEDKSRIKLDSKLKLLASRLELDQLGSSTLAVKLSSVLDIVKMFLAPYNPYTVVHTVDVPAMAAGTASAPVTSCFDLRLDVPDETALSALMKSRVLSVTFPTSPDETLLLPRDDYQELVHKHLEAVQNLVTRKRRRDFFDITPQDTLDFVNLLSTSQARDLRVIRGATSVNPEEERRSQYYHQQWVHDVIPRYIFRKSIIDTDARYLLVHRQE